MTHPSMEKPMHHRWFYSIASLVLLAVTLAGFRYFYLRLQAFPGRPLAPPIHTLLIIHGVTMTAWMLLSVVQPLLVASKLRMVHMKIGIAACVLAAVIVVTGYLVAVNAARLNPPDLRIFGLAPKEFLTVPLSGVLTFGAFVLIGVKNRRRPEVHRPMMFMASLAAIAAAMGRLPMLNAWYAGTRLEYWLSAFASTLVLGGLIVIAKCVLEKRIDRWFVGAYAGLTVVCVITSVIAKTAAWERVAAVLMR